MEQKLDAIIFLLERQVNLLEELNKVAKSSSAPPNVQPNMDLLNVLRESMPEGSRPAIDNIINTVFSAHGVNRKELKNG